MDGSKVQSPPPKRKQLPQRIDREGPYRLLYCSSKCDKGGVVQELNRGVEPNLADYHKRTALHLASCEGCPEIVLLLLEKGADVNAVDQWGHTPLSDARSCGREDICKILEAHGGKDPAGVYSQGPCYEIDQSEVDLEHAIFIEEGAYDEVYVVRWRGTEVAARTLRSCIASNPREKSIFMRELSLWQKLRHPNIVQFLGVLNNSDRLIFLTEYLRNGSLYDILKRKGRLAPETAVCYALDIARGMNYLHQHKPHPVMHRDLTPRTLLEDESGHLKVTDFALSKILGKKETYCDKMTEADSYKDNLSYRYMAPEVYRQESYGMSIDVFSFAIIVHEMFTGRPENADELPEQVAERQAYEDSRPSLSSFPVLIKTLLQECWDKNPERRPTFEQIIVMLETVQEDLVQKKAMGVCCSSWIL